jgi:ribose transport system substrate-binding protein
MRDGHFQLALGRRPFLFGAAGALTILFPAFESPVSDKPWLVNSIRSTRNPWLAWWDRGGQAYARAIDNSSRYLLQQSEGKQNVAAEKVQKIIADSSSNVVINFDAASPKEAQSIVDICKDAKVYFVTQFNKPDGIHPWTYDPYYVAHVWNDDFQFGRETAKILVEAIGHEGSIVALEGRNADGSARERFKGLQDVLAVNRHVNLLDHQDANWAASSAFHITRWLLARFGKQINGFWAANDSMALGAIEALRIHRLAGVLPVTGMDADEDALKAIRLGELTASLVVDSFWCGGIGLSLAYQAKIGRIDPKALTPDRREFASLYRVVTKANIDRFVTYRDTATPVLNWLDPYDPKNREII